MSEKVVAIYCFLDDYFIEVGNNQGSVKPQATPKVSDSIVLTTAIISAPFFGVTKPRLCSTWLIKKGWLCWKSRHLIVAFIGWRHPECLVLLSG